MFRHPPPDVRAAFVPAAHADMNVTPLIDVLLVLLIMFMAALPLTQQGVDVHLPAVVEQQRSTAPPSSIPLEYTADRRMAINTMASILRTSNYVFGRSSPPDATARSSSVATARCVMETSSRS